MTHPEGRLSPTLKGDREIEYAFMRAHLPAGAGWLLDLGPSPGGAATSHFALAQGYQVVAVGLEPIRLTHPRLTFVQGDFLKIALNQKFDWVLNVSTIEHFGLAGRYGVSMDDPDADLEGMARLRTVMQSRAGMLLTVPVGTDSVVRPLHRVYGAARLPALLEGYRISVQEFWAKAGGVDEYKRASPESALGTDPIARSSRPRADQHYYALGCFILEVET